MESALHNPHSAIQEVAAALLDYLGRRLGLPGLGYSSPPAPVPDGWETDIYAFRLQGAGLPPDWDRPLLLRVHANERALPRARHEFTVAQRLAELGYPVPEPVLLEEGCDLFGGPFLVMEQVPGPTLLRVMLRQPWNFLHFPTQMAEAHVRLHGLPAKGFPASPGPFLERHLGAMQTALVEHGLEGLSAGLGWVRAHRPGDSDSPSILHLDFHPLNLIERDDGSLAVLDWTYADLGDPHADVATTLLILDCFLPPEKSLWERLASRVGRPIISARYLHAYHWRRPLDDGLLTYYRAWAALTQLVRYGGWLRAGPEISGCKPSLVEHLQPRLLAALCRYFQRWSGVGVSL